MIDVNGTEHRWVPCEEGCPPDLYCKKCVCSDYDCDVLLAYDEGFKAGLEANDMDSDDL